MFLRMIINMMDGWNVFDPGGIVVDIDVSNIG